MMEHASCAACGADDAALLFTTPDTRNPASPERFPVGRCRRCGHIYVVDRPAPADIGRYYPANYEEHRKTDAPGRSRGATAASGSGRATGSSTSAAAAATTCCG
jgi:hypothetical protein